MAFNIDDYVPVQVRLELFYEQYPDGRCTTEIFSQTEKTVTFKAFLWKNLEEQGQDCSLSTGYAFEESGGMIEKYHENCETSAIGRALANIGILGKPNDGIESRPSREEMAAVPVKKSAKELEQFAKDNFDLQEVPAEDYSEFEEVIAPPSRPAPRRSGRSQKMIDSGKDDLQAFAVPDTFKCVHSDFCQGDTFLKQEVAKRGPRVGQEIVVCRKNGDDMQAARGDNKQWCNAEWNREEFLSMSKRSETDWDNGSKDS